MMRGLIQRTYMTLMSLICILLSSCEHRELTDNHAVQYVRVYLDEEIKNITCGIYNEALECPGYASPITLRAVLASPETGKVMYESFLRGHGSDDRGCYIEGYMGAVPGEYNFMVYSFGSPVTLIKDTDNYHKMTAYTKSVGERALSYLPVIRLKIDESTIMTEPEHMLWNSCERVRVSRSMALDTLRNSEGEYFTACSIAKSYYLQLNIKGVQWVHAATGVLSGIAGSASMCMRDGYLYGDPANLFFYMKYADKKYRAGDNTSTATLYTTFTTFGKIPDQTSELALNFEFIKKDGSSQVEVIDITDAFDTPLAREKQWILLDKEITIQAPSGTGGMFPGVEDWNNIDADIEM